MKITTGQVADLLAVSGPTASKLGACGLLGENLGTPARPKWHLDRAFALSERPPGPDNLPGESVLLVSMGRPQFVDGRAVGWHEDWPERYKREAVAGIRQAPFDVTGLVATVAGAVVGAWRVTGSAVDSQGWVTFEINSLQEADPLSMFLGKRMSAAPGPTKKVLRG